MPDPLLTDVLTVGALYPLALTGDQAFQAYGLVDRRGTRELEVATESPEPMEKIAATVRAGLEERGWSVRPLETDPLSARLIVTDPTTEESRTLDLLKETLWRPPVRTDLGPVLSLEDVVGTKVRALTDRGAARDLVDVHAAADRWSLIDLEELGRRHTHDTFDLADLQSRLEAVEWLSDSEFTRYGLDEADITVLRRWAQSWADDIAERLLEEQALQAPPDE
ncbi:nucleotidyl transferase AbiEii/AbiGii toxin family protein [Streptomyces sp. NPDC002845]